VVHVVSVTECVDKVLCRINCAETNSSSAARVSMRSRQDCMRVEFIDRP